MISKTLTTILFCAGLVLPYVAQANTYEKPSMDNIMRTMVRYGVVDINDNSMLDIFARVIACDLYQKYYKDEFAWRDIRGKIRDVIKEEVATYPTGYNYDTTLKLARYDFDKKAFPFANGEKNTNVNAFRMEVHRSDFCTQDNLYGFPETYRLVLNEPIKVPDLPLKEEEAKALVERMDNDGNKTHLVFASFKIRVMFIASLVPESAQTTGGGYWSADGAKVRQSVKREAISLDSQLDAIEFYEDEARTKLIYIYRP